VGPVYALIHSHSLAQQLANHSINLCSALGGLVSALAGLGASQELQEDMAQLVKQLGRGLHCSYSEAQHRVPPVQVRKQRGQLRVPYAAATAAVCVAATLSLRQQRGADGCLRPAPLYLQEAWPLHVNHIT
jgi:hypothetical protein